MILCTVVTDWISATATTLAFCATAFAIYDTRKNAIETQKQVDSLAKLAMTYEKTRRDEINPNFIIKSVDTPYLGEHCNLILENRGGLAKHFKIIRAEFENVYQISEFNEETTIGAKQSTILKFKFKQKNYPNFIDNLHPLTIELQFMNKDDEHCTQILKRLETGKCVSYYPELK